MDDEQEVKRKMLAKWVAQRDNLTVLIEAIKRELAEEVQSPTEALTSRAGTLTFMGSPPVIMESSTVKPGEFFGLSQTDAAAAYIKKIGHAVPVEQILEALKTGGVKVGGADPKTTLYVGLIRGTKRFVLVGPGTFGLVEFYPDRPRKEKREAGKKRRKGKRAKGRNRTATSA